MDIRLYVLGNDRLSPSSADYVPQSRNPAFDPQLDIREPASGSADLQSAGKSSMSSKTGNRVTFTNDGSKPMHLKFTPNAGQAPVPDILLPPGASKTMSFPAGWSGNWRSTAGGGNAYTLGEVAFQGHNGMTFYDDSRIEGSNMGQTIKPASIGRKTGSLDNLLDGAPPGVIAVNGQGQPYGIKKSTINDIQDPAVVSYLDKRIPEGMGYTYPTDDASTAGTPDTHLIVHMKDFI